MNSRTIPHQRHGWSSAAAESRSAGGQHPPEAGGPAELDVDATFRDLAALALEPQCPEQFGDRLLKCTAELLGATGGAIWRHNDDQWRAIGMSEADSPPTQHTAGEHWSRFLSHICREGRCVLISPQEQLPTGGINPQTEQIILAPWLSSGTAAGVLELRIDVTTTPAAQSGYLRFASVLAGIVTEFFRQEELRQLRQQCEAARNLQQLCERWSRPGLSPDLPATIVADLRRELAADRVSYLERRGTRCRMQAISGTEIFDRRASEVRTLEELADTAVDVDEPLGPLSGGSEGAASSAGQHTGAEPNLPVLPAASQALNAYRQGHPDAGVWVIPLAVAAESDGEQQQATRESCFGAVIVERFADAAENRQQAETAITERLAILTPVIERMLGRANSLKTSGWARLTQRISGGSGKDLPGMRLLAGVLLAVVVIGMLALIPAELRIPARGELQPAIRRHVFAAADGVVDELLVGEGQSVRAGQELLRMRQSALDFELSRVAGELQTAQKKLAGIEAELLGAGTSGNGRVDARRHRQLSADQDELNELIRTLRQQQQILAARQNDLTIRSPLTGAVATWNLDRRLHARPVQQGQILMTVADVAGPWVLEVRVPDARLGHLLRARKKYGDDLRVEFVFATDPATTYRGRVQSIAPHTEVHETDGPCGLVMIAIDRDAIPELRPGTTVLPEILCGSRPVGYVWLHEMIDAVRLWCWM